MLGEATLGPLPAGAWDASVVFDVQVEGPVDRLVARVAGADDCDPDNDEAVWDAVACP